MYTVIEVIYSETKHKRASRYTKRKDSFKQIVSIKKPNNRQETSGK